MKNLFDISGLDSSRGEQTDLLYENSSSVTGEVSLRVERIISFGEASPEGFWYDQGHDEWVSVLKGNAVIEYENGIRETLHEGDQLLLTAHTRHRVASASAECIWLAIHIYG